VSGKEGPQYIQSGELLFGVRSKDLEDFRWLDVPALKKVRHLSRTQEMLGYGLS